MLEAESRGDRFLADTAAITEATQSTGGSFVRNRNDLQQIFAELVNGPGESYILSFVPQTADGKFHDLKVRVHEHSGTVQARRGYFAPSPEQDTSAALRSIINKEVDATDMQNAITAHVSVTPQAASQKASPSLLVNARLNLRQFHLQHQHGRYVGRVTVVFALLDSNGGFITGKEGELDLALKPGTLSRLQRSGFTATMRLAAPAGKYRFRAVIADDFAQRIGTLNGNVALQ